MRCQKQSNLKIQGKYTQEGATDEDAPFLFSIDAACKSSFKSSSNRQYSMVISFNFITLASIHLSA